MVWANLRVPSFAASAFGKAIWPLTAIKNAGLASKYLIQARGPSWVTECATVFINARTARSTATDSSGDTECERLAPAKHGTQTAAKATVTNRKRIRNLHARGRTGSKRLEDD